MLEQILATKREEVKQLYRLQEEGQAQQQQPFRGSQSLAHEDQSVAEAEEVSVAPGQFVSRTERMELPRSFSDALRRPNRSTSLIAEVKKASPSKGLIREDFDPLQIALAYEKAGADCLSVLTDEAYFQGHPDYIARIKEHVSVPILRKEFIIDPIQVEQSVRLGADAILLIAKALPIQQLAELYQQAQESGLDCLVEISSREEAEQVLDKITPDIIGINNRDLHTFTTTTNVTKQLLPYIPEGVLVISESGIRDSEAVRDLQRHGVHGFLIGEHFMRQERVEEAVKALYE